MRGRLLDDFDIEIGGGLGPWAGKLLRIGLMGVNARVDVVTHFLEALDAVL